MSSGGSIFESARGYILLERKSYFSAIELEKKLKRLYAYDYNIKGKGKGKDRTFKTTDNSNCDGGGA